MDFNFENELKDKIALVTGGSKGAGKAIADRLLKAGATVIITARNNPEDHGNGIHFISADLSKPEGTQKVVEEIQKRFGHLDILVNNLGGSETPGGGFAVLTDQHWEESFQTNLLAPVRLDRGFLPGMIEQRGGVIIHIASIQAKLPLYDSTLPYAAAKAALVNYSKSFHPKRRTCAHRFAGLDHDELVNPNAGTHCPKFGWYNRRSRKQRHRCIGRHSVWQSSLAGGSCRVGRLPGLAQSRLSHRDGIHHRRRHSPHDLS